MFVVLRLLISSDCDKNKGGRDILGERHASLCKNSWGALCVWVEEKGQQKMGT